MWVLAGKGTDTVALAAMPRGPRKLAIPFNAAALTQYGGIYLLHRVSSRIDFKSAPAAQIRATQRNNRYSIGESVPALVHRMILRLEQIKTTNLLRQNRGCSISPAYPALPNPPPAAGCCSGGRPRSN